jgi:multiple antibiotic resistance protein
MHDLAIQAFTTFFVTIGPLDIAGLFMPLCVQADAAARRSMALRGTLVGAGVLFAFALSGAELLHLLGISLPAFRLAGGVLLMLLAIEMVFARHSNLTIPEGQEAHSKDDVSIFPLAVPLIAGPGAITSAILLMSQVKGDWSGQLVVLGMLALVLLLTLLTLLVAARVVRLFGVTGVNVVTRVLGIVLTALAAQFMLDGLRDSGLLSGR